MNKVVLLLLIGVVGFALVALHLVRELRAVDGARHDQLPGTSAGAHARA